MQHQIKIAPKGCPFPNISIYYSLVCSCVARLQRYPGLIRAMSSRIKASMLMAPGKKLFLIPQQRQLFDPARLCRLLGRRNSIALVKFYFQSCRTVYSMHSSRAIGKVVITAFQAVGVIIRNPQAYYITRNSLSDLQFRQLPHAI